MKMPCLAALCLLTPWLAEAAGFNGTLVFTDEEKAIHLEKLGNALDITAECLQADLKRHKKFIKDYKISAFYGDNSPFNKTTGPDGKKLLTSVEEKRQKLREFEIDEELIPQMVPERPCAGGIEECPLMLQPTSCIGLAVKCLSKGMKESGQEAIWAKLRKYMIDNGVRGDAVIDGLQKLGWKVLYWNPDTSRNERWDEEEKDKYPGNPQNIWGQHASMWKTVKEKQRYYFNSVDDWSSMVDFRRKTPKIVKKAPFFFGIAHIGYHVFPGSYGRIIEGHSTRELDDKKTLESSWFSPMRFLGGGGPRGGPYKSGLVALPPVAKDDPNPEEEDPGEER